MKDNQKKNNPAAGNKGQGDTDTRNKKQGANNPAARDAHKKDGQERRSSEKIARKGTDTTQKNPAMDDTNPTAKEAGNKTQAPGSQNENKNKPGNENLTGTPEAKTNTPEDKTNTPWKDPDPTREKRKEVYAEPGETGDDTTINPRTENQQRNTGTQNERNEEVIEEERQRGTNKSGDTNKIEEGDVQRSDPGTFDPQAGNDTEAFTENKQNKNTGESDTTNKTF